MRGRFAPSPTGDLHLGNARTALLAWLQVRAAGGRMVLRVEDLDAGRVRPGIMEAQLRQLRWLGLDWDEGPDVGGPYAPYEQSRRQQRFAAALQRLERSGTLYSCVCSRREIAAAASAPHAGDEEGPAYSGACRTLEPGELSRLQRERGPAAVRFCVPPGPVHVRDQLHGDLEYEPAREIGDFVVRRKDGVAAYQLAVVVDDAAMGITHVLRGADLLPSTARQILLYRALDLDPPAWLHVPLLLGPDGERLAKRHGSVSLRELHHRGVAPEQVVGWLASTCGLADPGEHASPSELVPRFSPERLPRDPSVVGALPWD